MMGQGRIINGIPDKHLPCWTSTTGREAIAPSRRVDQIREGTQACVDDSREISLDDLPS